ncbi:MAG: ribonuclease H family protein [Candidatus Thiodiazotropha sp.]
MIQPEPAYNPGDLVRTLKHPKYWSQLGSSKSRSTEQQEKGKGIIQQLLLEAPARSSIAFTDGSCLGNPGPCGAGAVIYLPDEQSGIELTRPVAARGSILLAELVAVLLVLESVTSKRIWELSSCLQIFSDSQSAVGILTLNWASENYTDIIFKIKSFLQQLKTKGFDVIIHWTPGHATIEGNEIADRLAKDAAQQASNMPLETSIVTLQDIKSSSKKSIISKWQQRWDISDSGRFFYMFKPTVNGKLFLDIPCKELGSSILQLRTGYNQLNEYKHKLNQCDSAECECGDIETVQHFLLECPLYEDHRQILQRNLFFELGINYLDLPLLLGYNENTDHSGWREAILKELGEYIKNTGRLARRVSESGITQ